MYMSRMRRLASTYSRMRGGPMMVSGSSRSTCEESIRMPGMPVTWSAWVWEMKTAEIFFQRRFRRRRLIWVPSPQSNSSSSPSRRSSTEVRLRPGRGIMPPVPRMKTSMFIGYR